MGLAADIFSRQRIGRVRDRTGGVIESDQRTFRCLYRGQDEVQVFKGCLKCPAHISGYLCHHPAVVAKRRPKHICLIDAPALKDSAIEEGYFVCSSCRYRTTFQIPSSPSWAVGIVTAPRRKPTLSRSLTSLQSAGFDPIVFAEPCSDLSGVNGKTVIERHRKLGGWSNWFAALQHLVSLNSDLILLCQDDVIYTRNIRSYIEKVWPRGAEIISFYCSSAYVAEPPFFQHTPPPWGIRGALTLTFPRQTAERILESKLLRDYGRQSAVDGIIGKWARRQGVDVFFCYPSLADHIGNTSTIHPNAHNEGTRRSSTFVGEEYDATDLLAISR